MLDQYLHHFYFFRKGLFTNMEKECHSIFVMVALLEVDEAKKILRCLSFAHSIEPSLVAEVAP